MTAERVVYAARSLRFANTLGKGVVEAWLELSAALDEYEREISVIAAKIVVNDQGARTRDASEGSIRAAITIPDRGSLRGQMLGLFANLNYAGWTDFELTDHFARDPRTIGSCRRDLVKAGLIEEHGDTRCKDSDVGCKRPCQVWVITDHGLAVWKKLEGQH